VAIAAAIAVTVIVFYNFDIQIATVTKYLRPRIEPVFRLSATTARTSGQPAPPLAPRAPSPVATTTTTAATETAAAAAKATTKTATTTPSITTTTTTATTSSNTTTTTIATTTITAGAEAKATTTTTTKSRMESPSSSHHPTALNRSAVASFCQGRLGNQMSAYATLYALEREYGVRALLNPEQEPTL
jgi:hypothetical protein